MIRPVPSAPRVLLVDDSPIVGRAVAQLLQGHATIELSHCQDPQQALQEIARRQPTVVLLDLDMPGLDGLSLLRSLRARPELATLPVVIMSDRDQPDLPGRAFAAGATDFLLKMPSEAELVARIEHQTRVYVQQHAVHQALRNNQKSLEEKNRRLETLAQQLSEAHAEARAASEVKRTFLANMSHEIRTPMNAIIGLTRLCLDSDLTARQRDYLGHVDRAAGSLLRTLSDILDLSKIEAGEMALEPAPLSLRELLDSVCQALEPQAQEQKVRLVWKVDGEVPEQLLADEQRLRQVLASLIGNAVKFTPDGEVEVRVSPGPRHGTQHELHFMVRDTGIGIAPEKLEEIFAAFTQADSSTTRLYGGSGLGLAICSSLVEMMQGQIWVTSDLGEGSTFHFSIRAEAVSPEAAPPEPAASRPALRVLLAEDNPVNQLVATAYLEEMGAVVSLANDGQEAVEMARSQTFDLILMDLQMPRLDGFEATRQLRAAGLALPIVALTALAMKGAAEMCLEAGMNAYVPKPLEAATLFSALERVLPCTAPPGVLIVESSSFQRRQIARLLRRPEVVISETDSLETARRLVAAGGIGLVLAESQLSSPELRRGGARLIVLGEGGSEADAVLPRHFDAPDLTCLLSRLFPAGHPLRS